MFDLHSHVLPALDDGPGDAAEALAILRALVEEGANAVVATPHVRDDHPTSAATMHASLEALRRDAATEGLAIEILPGGEIALDRLPHLDDSERTGFGLGGNPHLLLLEFPAFGWPYVLPMVVRSLLDDGIVPVLGHPERNAAVQDRPELLAESVRAGAIVQITAGSITGRFGRQAETCAGSLIDAGLVHAVASDVHGLDVRPPSLLSARRALRDEDLAQWLLDDAPRALVTGRPLPRRPPRRRRVIPWSRGRR